MMIMIGTQHIGAWARWVTCDRMPQDGLSGGFKAREQLTRMCEAWKEGSEGDHCGGSSGHDRCMVESKQWLVSAPQAAMQACLQDAPGQPGNSSPWGETMHVRTHTAEHGWDEEGKTLDYALVVVRQCNARMFIFIDLSRHKSIV